MWACNIVTSLKYFSIFEFPGPFFILYVQKPLLYNNDFSVYVEYRRRRRVNKLLNGWKHEKMFPQWAKNKYIKSAPDTYYNKMFYKSPDTIKTMKSILLRHLPADRRTGNDENNRTIIKKNEKQQFRSGVISPRYSGSRSIYFSSG